MRLPLLCFLVLTLCGCADSRSPEVDQISIRLSGWSAEDIVVTRDGKGHFRVRIVSEDFQGLRTVQRHQLVYRSLADLMQTDIHALGISALTPAEAIETH